MLTDDERERLCICAELAGSCDVSSSQIITACSSHVATVEQILAARLAALTAERDELRQEVTEQNRLAQSAASMMSNAQAKRAKAEADLAAANARIERMELHGPACDCANDYLMEVQAENAALRDRIDRVTALADEWESEAGTESEVWRVYGPQNISVPSLVAAVRAALAATDSPMSDCAFCGHARHAHRTAAKWRDDPYDTGCVFGYEGRKSDTRCTCPEYVASEPPTDSPGPDA